MSKNYDGLQNDLDSMEGIFLKRGGYTKPLDENRQWEFTPLMNVGDRVYPGSWLGEVKENLLTHKIMAPFNLEDEWENQFDFWSG